MRRAKIKTATFWVAVFCFRLSELSNTTPAGYETDERCSLGDVATAAGGGCRERKEAPRSKKSRIGAAAPDDFFGHRKNNECVP